MNINDIEIIPLHGYGGRYRDLAKDIKDPYNDEAREKVAIEMAEYIEPGAYIVPAPSSSGTNNSMLFLAEEIELLTDDTEAVEAVVRDIPVKSSEECRKLGLPTPTLEEHYDSMMLEQDIPDDDNLIYIIDNVYTSGKTVKAVAMMLDEPYERIIFLVYTRTTRGRTKKNPPIRRICISGSRNYENLENITKVLETLVASDTVIIHGGARGVDIYADMEAKRMNFLDIEEWPAEWERYGRAAGPKRNNEMIDTCDKLFAFWNGKSRGTRNAISIAKSKGIEYEVIPDAGEIKWQQQQ